MGVHNQGLFRTTAQRIPHPTSSGAELVIDTPALRAVDVAVIRVVALTCQLHYRALSIAPETLAGHRHLYPPRLHSAQRGIERERGGRVTSS